MTNKLNHSVFSTFALIFVGIVFALNYIYGNTLSDLLILVPSDVVHKLYLWKTITFQFVPSGIESIVLFFLVFYFISPRLENFISGLKYPLWLFLLTVLEGCLLTLVFINSSVAIAGIDGISFYVLVVYSLLCSKDKITILNFPPMPILAFALLAGLIWFGFKLVNFSTFGNDSYFLSAIGTSVFGTTAGLLHFLQIRLTGYSQIKQREQLDEKNIKLPGPEELSVAHHTNLRMRKFYQNQNYNYSDDYTDILSEDMQENEEKLNDILDKISNLGKDSLNNYEKKFLEEYSKIL